jgi:hypothetical protein
MSPAAPSSLPRYSRITGTGSYLPPRRVSNEQLAAQLAERGIETSDEWIVARTGIRARHFADADVPGGPYIVDGQVAVPTMTDDAARRVVGTRMRQRGRRAGNRPVVYCVFDLLVEFGFDMLLLPLERRKQHLAAMPLSGNGLMLVQPLHTGRLPLRRVMLEKGIERVVAKRLDSNYEPGRRCPSWVLVERPHAAPARGAAV